MDIASLKERVSEIVFKLEPDDTEHAEFLELNLLAAIDALNRYQRFLLWNQSAESRGDWFACPGHGRPLTATRNGWACAACSTEVLDWAWGYMLDAPPVDV